MFRKIKEKWLHLGIMMATLFSSKVAYASANNFDPFSNIQFDDRGVNVGTAIEGSNLDYASILTKYKGVLHLIGGFIIVTAIGMMIFRFYRLAASGSNEMERRKAIRGILATGISLALLGCFTMLAGVVYEAFN